MILHERDYFEYIQKQGVGDNDQVASSPKSYISYLNSVSRLIKKDITPNILRSEEHIKNILNQIRNERADNTIRNYGSAMRQYVNMVKAFNL